MRDMEVVVDPNAPPDPKEGVHADVCRSPPGRDVQVGFPAPPEDTPKSTGSSRIASDGQSNCDDLDQIPDHDVPEALRRAAALASAAWGQEGQSASVEVAGLPLAEFWKKVLILESAGGKHGSAVSRVEKLLKFRQRWSWPLSIGARHVETALRSGATTYLPPRWPGDPHLVVFTAHKLNTRLCTVQEYQMLIMFMLEAAFRESSPEHHGVTIVLDVRMLSSVLWQACLSGISDIPRGVEMCSALPVKASHVQLIEDGARIAHYTIGLILSKLSPKMRSRVNRGGPQAALSSLGQETLPDFLGGQRDAAAEFAAWLERLPLEDLASIANASGRSAKT